MATTELAVVADFVTLYNCLDMRYCGLQSKFWVPNTTPRIAAPVPTIENALYALLIANALYASLCALSFTLSNTTIMFNIIIQLYMFN